MSNRPCSRGSTCQLCNSVALHLANFAGMNNAIRGPQSYFPSIESKYGQPISHWMSILENLPDSPHMEMVRVLKEQHSMGHGHANALVAFFRAQRQD